MLSLSIAMADSGLYLYTFSSSTVIVKPGKSVTLEVGMGINAGYSYTIQWGKSVSGSGGSSSYEIIDGAAGTSYTVRSVREEAKYICIVTASDGCRQTAFFNIRLDNSLSMLLLEGQTVKVPVSSNAGNFVQAVIGDSGVISASRNTVTAIRSGTTTLKLEYRNTEISYTVEVLPGNSLLSLPADLEIIEEEAFQGAQSAQFVALGPAVQAVRSEAFSGSGLRQIAVYGMSTSFEPDAFGDLRPQILCFAGSEAESFALQNGYDYLYLP